MSANEAETWQELLKSIENFLIDNQSEHYIFRGQSKRTEPIRSVLHRELYGQRYSPNSLEIPSSLPDPLERAQKELLKNMPSRFFTGENETEVLAQLQHLGAFTNFIDFTSDYLVALFFACSSFDAQAEIAEPTLYFYRVDKNEFIEDDNTSSFEENFIFRSRSQHNRIIAQRACLVYRRSGILAKSEKENIPAGFPSAKSKKNDGKIFYLPIKAEWRQEILKYLDQRGISYLYLFNDLEGYVRYRSKYTVLNDILRKKQEFSAALDKGNYTESIKLLEEIVQENQIEAAEYVRIFITRYRNAKKDAANFGKLIGQEERATIFYLLRGFLDEEKEPEEAIKNYSKSIEKNKNFYLPYFVRGNLHLNQSDFYKEQGKQKEAEEKWKLALEDYNKTIELNPAYVYVYDARGILHQKQGNFYKEQGKAEAAEEKWKLALEDYNKAVELNPAYANAYYNRGLLYSNQDRFYKEQGKQKEAEEKWKLALEDYNKAIELNPAYVYVYDARGILHQNQGNFYKEQGKAEEAEEKWKLALEDYNKAVELNPAYANAYYNRGLLYSNQDRFYKEQGKQKEAEEKWKLALKDYNTVIELNPVAGSSTHWNRGCTYESQGDFYNEQGEREKAEENWKLAAVDFNRVLELQPDLHFVRYRLNALHEKINANSRGE